MEIITNSEKQTFNFAKKYAKQLKGGDIIGLIGDLGAGKTIFTKGLANGLGVKETITSPTFIIMKVYEIKNPSAVADEIRNLTHIDTYRIKNEQDIISIGADEYFKRNDTITIIEWADKIRKILPKKTKIIKIKYNNNYRKIIF